MRARNPDPKPRRGREGKEYAEVRGVRTKQVLYLSTIHENGYRDYTVLFHE